MRMRKMTSVARAAYHFSIPFATAVCTHFTSKITALVVFTFFLAFMTLQHFTSFSAERHTQKMNGAGTRGTKS